MDTVRKVSEVRVTPEKYLSGTWFVTGPKNLSALYATRGEAVLRGLWAFISELQHVPIGVEEIRLTVRRLPGEAKSDKPKRKRRVKSKVRPKPKSSRKTRKPAKKPKTTVRRKKA